MANTNLAPQFNYTGNDLVDTGDSIYTIQNDLKSFYLNYNKSQNTLYMAVVKSSAYTATSADNVIFVDSTNNVTITLPTAIGNRGKQFTIKDWKGNANTKNITIATTSAQNIDAGGSLTINTNYGSYTVCSDNANWFIIAKV